MILESTDLLNNVAHFKMEYFERRKTDRPLTAHTFQAMRLARYDYRYYVVFTDVISTNRTATKSRGEFPNSANAHTRMRARGERTHTHTHTRML